MSYDIQYSVFNSQESVSPPSSGLRGLSFSPDGLKMYSLFQSSNRLVQYNLSTAFDVSTASFFSSFVYSSQDTNMADIFWGDDGEKLYLIGKSSRSVHEYDVSTAYTISTASFNQSLVVSSQDTEPSSLTFRSNGESLYISGSANDSLYQYNLSTAWDISTATFITSYDISSKISDPTGIFLHPSGLYIFVVGRTNDKIVRYNFGSPYLISALVYSQQFTFVTPSLNPSGLYFQPDSDYFFSLNYDTNTVFKYYVPTPVYEISGYVTVDLTPIAFAKMRCIAQGTATLLAPVFSDADGFYKFTNLLITEKYHVATERTIDGVPYNAWSFWDIIPVMILI